MVVKRNRDKSSSIIVIHPPLFRVGRVFPYDKNSRNIIFRIGHPFLTISRKKKKNTFPGRVIIFTISNRLLFFFRKMFQARAIGNTTCNGRQGTNGTVSPFPCCCLTFRRSRFGCCGLNIITTFEPVLGIPPCLSIMARAKNGAEGEKKGSSSVTYCDTECWTRLFLYSRDIENNSAGENTTSLSPLFDVRGRIFSFRIVNVLLSIQEKKKKGKREKKSRVHLECRLYIKSKCRTVIGEGDNVHRWRKGHRGSIERLMPGYFGF